MTIYKTIIPCEAFGPLILDNFFTVSEKNQKDVPRPQDPIENVFFNFKKGCTTVKWKDGEITTVKCQEGDSFDPEKGLALCFMKKAYDNRGCFNEFLNDWMVDAKEQ